MSRQYVLTRPNIQLSDVPQYEEYYRHDAASRALARHKELQEQPREILGRLDAVLNQDLGRFNKTVADAGVPPVVVVPFEKRR